MELTFIQWTDAYLVIPSGLLVSINIQTLIIRVSHQNEYARQRSDTWY